MIRWFAGHPTAANLLLILLLAAGLFAAPNLKRETFPDYRPVEISIDVVYRGASAADVEDAVCRRLYDAVKGVDYLDEIECVAQDNLARATVSMEAAGDSIRFLSDIDTEVNALTDLPARAERPVVRELHRSDLVAAVAVHGDLAPNRLEDYALQLEERIMALPGVAQVTLQGLSQRQWQVEIPRASLAQYQLSASDLAIRLRQQSIDVPLGTLETPDRDILLRFTDQRRSLQELADLVVVSGSGGGELTLGQIATLRETGEQPEALVYFNDQRAVVLEVSKTLRDDSLNVLEELTALVNAERQRIDGPLQLTMTQNMTSIVRDRLQMLVSNGIAGLALLIVVMGLFFRPRLALWAVLGLPIAFAGAFFVMSLSGLSLNMITLVALLMAIGIVMDDAVVIADNIAVQARGGASPLEAVVEGTRQVLPGVVSSFLTTVWVFAPLAFLVGELGAVLKVLPVVLIAALFASLIEALWILPHHLKGSVLSLQASTQSRFRTAFDHHFGLFQERVGRLADKAVRWRYGVLGGVLFILLGTAGFMAGGHVSTEAMPDLDGDTLEARILLPQGTPLAHTERAAGQVSDAMWHLNEIFTPDQPDEAPLVDAIQVRFNYNPSAREAGAHVATVMVDLLSAELRTMNLDELTVAWRNEIGDIPGLSSLIIQEPGFGPAGIPIEVRLQGPDLADLKAASLDVSDYLAGYEAVYNIIDDLRPGKPQRTFTLTDGALAAGLTAEMVASQLRAAFLGEVVDTQRIGRRDVDILVRQSQGDRDGLDDLADQTILMPDGRQMPLEVVVDIHDQRDWAMITRVGGQRTVTVQANVNASKASAQAVVNDMRGQWLAGLEQRHPNVAITFEGQVARSAETGGSIARGLMIGLLGVFVILSFQFRSYSEPLIVMLAIPLAFVGALWGHVLLGWYISMPSMIGAASLAGIVVNDSILLVQFIKENRRKGLSAIVAAGQASRDRLRAILITSTTTIAGLLPLLAETSVQSAAIKPLVISVVFGLLATTVLVLVMIPAVYVLFDDWGWTANEPAETE
ncbi:efflux RND transporter permease subunit [Marinobacter sp.]|uniref:efflux RND transporter permease subunit n=1 Tax=Marinobacter sp. TaxID=50741 RepID=UPI003A9459C7